MRLTREQTRVIAGMVAVLLLFALLAKSVVACWAVISGPHPDEHSTISIHHYDAGEPKASDHAKHSAPCDENCMDGAEAFGGNLDLKLFPLLLAFCLSAFMLPPPVRSSSRPDWLAYAPADPPVSIRFKRLIN